MGYKKVSILARDRRTRARKEVLVLCDNLDETAKSRVMELTDRVASLQGTIIISSQPVLRGVGAYSKILYGETDNSFPAAVLLDCPRRLCGLWISSAERNGLPLYEFNPRVNRYKPLKRR